MQIEGGLALVGFMGAGKTTVGQLVAQKLAWPFVDTDALLHTRHGPVEVQLRRDGPEVFRQREAQVVKELCDGQRRVLATGGGVYALAANRESLDGSYLTVHLAASLATLRGRVVAAGAADRPLWDGDVEALYRARQAAYGLAAVQICTDERSPQEVANLVLEVL